MLGALKERSQCKFMIYDYQNIIQIQFSRMSELDTDNGEKQSETTFLATPEPRPSKRSHWSKVHPGRGSRNFDPLDYSTRIAGKGGAAEATHYTFGIGGKQKFYREPSDLPISKLEVIRNKGTGLKGAIRKHNPAELSKRLDKRLKSILKKPGQAKKPPKAINSNSKNPKSVIFDLVINKSIWKKSKVKTPPSTTTTNADKGDNANNINQVYQEESK